MGCFEDVFDVVQELVRLLLKVPVDELPGLGVNSELAGDKDEIASSDALIRDKKLEHNSCFKLLLLGCMVPLALERVSYTPGRGDLDL